MMQNWIWLVLVLVLLVVEFLTVGLTTIWFAAGALIAYGVALLNGSLPLQIIVFLAVSIVLFLLTRPIVIKRLNKNRTKTNVDRLIGETARVTEEIDPFRQTGTALLNGLTWTARSKGDAVIPAGAKVRVLEVQGVKLIVEEIPSDSEKTEE